MVGWKEEEEYLFQDGILTGQKKMKIEFEKQFGKGSDPWYAKAERWIKKKFKNPYKNW